MALPPTWVSAAISEVESSEDPHIIAKAICENPRFLNAIRSGIAEFYEMTERNKEMVAKHGGGVFCGAPTMAETIRGKLIEAMESTEF